MVVVVCGYQNLGENDESRTNCTDINHKHLGEERRDYVIGLNMINV